MKLTDTQLILLCSAASGPHGLLMPPEGRCEKDLRTIAKPLLKHHLVEEFWVEPAQPSWWLDEGGRRMGLGISGEGLKAIGWNYDTRTSELCTVAGGEVAADADANVTAEADKASEDSHAVLAIVEAERSAPLPAKKTIVLALLCREGGATIAELASATGWLPHTVRAHLTGIRKSGTSLAKETHSGTTTYRIADASVDEVANAVTDREA